MTDHLDLVSEVQAALALLERPERYWLAYSGGLDSRVLLDILLRLREQCRDFPPVHVVHVNHGLQDAADQWEQHCRALCDARDIPLLVHRVVVSEDGEGPEAAARRARYRAFESTLQRGDVLLLAHHLDDQAETVLQRMLRGAGLQGVAGIPPLRSLGAGRLFRPLLAVPRERLSVFAQREGLDWDEDPSNAQANYDRNYLRHHVMPLLATRWPAYRRSFARVAEHSADSAALLDEYLEADLGALMDGATLDLSRLLHIPAHKQLPLLNHFLRSRCQLRLEQAQLHMFAEQFLKSRADAQPQVVHGPWRFYRHRQRLYVEPRDIAEQPHAQAVQWSLTEPLRLPCGVLSARPGGEFLPSGKVTVEFRRSGERCQLAGEGHHRSLKKLLQQWDLPPLQRARLPLIYCDGELAAIADLAVCEGFSAPKGDGWQVCWQDVAGH